jgi:uncharacterized damage-inducible protein DinB
LLTEDLLRLRNRSAVLLVDVIVNTANPNHVERSPCASVRTRARIEHWKPRSGNHTMEYQNGPDFLKYFEKIRTRTARVVACIPPDQIEWRPAPGLFSLGDLVRHLAATERFMFGENVQGNISRYPGHGPELAAGHDSVMQYFQRMHAETVAILRQLTALDLQRYCSTPGGVELPVWKWLRSMIEHEVHHRGQLYLMLRLLGVPTPPLYGLTSEEVRARSQA